MYELDGKVALVTGATGGIGRLLCCMLAQRGCRIAPLGRNPQQMDALTEQLRRSGTPHCPQRVDLKDRTALREAVAAVQRDLGDIDLAIHCAGIVRVTDAVAPDLDDTEEILEVNYLGGMYLFAEVMPKMIGRGSGHLVAVGSLAGLRGLPWSGAYCASKAALAHSMESLRPALRRRGILVTTCYPGFVRTPMTDALPPRLMAMASPDFAAGEIVRAILRRSRVAYFPLNQALSMRFMRRLPAWAFDTLMAKFGHRQMEGDY